jgi:hypothetical protein
MKYGIATVIIDKKEYIIGAITMANNIRKNYINYELIVLIKNIEEEEKKILKMFFDKIIEIELINGNIKLSRFNVLKLIEYEKILLLDADAIIIENINEIFRIEINENEAACLYINNKYHPSFILLKPNNEKYEEIKKIKNMDINLLFKNIKKIDEKYLISSDIYEKKKDKEYKGIQFIGDKPFITNKNIELSKRIYRSDFKIWFEKFKEVKKMLLEYDNNELFKEVNYMMKYFLYKPQERYILINKKLKQKKKNIKYIRRTYKIDDINKINNIEYLHDNISKNYIITNNTKIIDSNIIDLIITDITVSLILIINNQDKLNTELKQYVIYEQNLRISGETLKYIIFNSDIFFTYDERKIFINNFNDYMNYDILIIAIKCRENLFLKGSNNFVYIYNNYNNKMLLMNMIYSDKIANNLVNYNLYNINMNNIDRLKLESLKKYIFNNFDYEQIKF